MAKKKPEETEADGPAKDTAATPEKAEASAPADPADATIEELMEGIDAATGAETRIAELEAEREELKDRLLRALAEAENTRRRAERDRKDAETYGGTRLARDMLGVVDNFERALRAANARTPGNADILNPLGYANRKLGRWTVSRDFYTRAPAVDPVREIGLIGATPIVVGSARRDGQAPVRWYNLGAHLLWIGERTRSLDGAHVEYFRGIRDIFRAYDRGPIPLLLDSGATAALEQDGVGRAARRRAVITALEKGAFELLYQPCINSDGRVVALEALTRLREHLAAGSTGLWIPSSERTHGASGRLSNVRRPESTRFTSHP